MVNVDSIDAIGDLSEIDPGKTALILNGTEMTVDMPYHKVVRDIENEQENNKNL